MSEAKPSKSGLRKDHARFFIDVIVEGDHNTLRKIFATFEDDEALRGKTFTGKTAYQDAKTWIKDNL